MFQLSAIFHLLSGLMGFSSQVPVSPRTFGSSQGRVCQSPRIHRCCRS